MSKAHERVVEAQFGPRAKAYVESAVHSQGADLEAIGTLAQNAALALDLGAGGGHVSYALARHAGSAHGVADHRWRNGGGAGRGDAWLHDL